ncbi:hypothetical protein Tco_1008908, partial [Tanacetum coccineum]
DEHLSTFCAEEIVPIPRESKDTSRSDSKNILPSYDDFSSINIPHDDSVTFSNPLFVFDVNFNSSNINPLFDEVLEDIKYECLAPGDDIEILLHHDPSTPMKSIASILEGFIDEQSFKENDDLFDLECKTNDWKRILYDAPIDETECFDPGGDNDEIDAFLAIKVPMYIEGYYDSEGDIIYLESLLSDDTTHNFSPEVIFDHEPQHNTFSPKSDPLHHEFTGELITIPPGIVREHEDYINRMSLLCSNSSSRSLENSHTIIESLPTSTTLVEDSDSNRERIDLIFRTNGFDTTGIDPKNFEDSRVRCIIRVHLRFPAFCLHILGRPGIRALGAVPSTAHGMIKFLTRAGVATIITERAKSLEIQMVRQAEVPTPEPVENVKVAINPECPEQTIMIGGSLSIEGKKAVCEVLKVNLDVFAWKPADMTGVPRILAEHKLGIKEITAPVRQKKRGQAPERSKFIV